VFGQLRYKLTDKLELAAGVRWTDEERELSVFDFQRNVDLTPLLPRPRLESSDPSPEATITYTPTDDLTAFASYKKGFKSGSFSVAVPTAPIFDASGNIVGATDQSFDDEEVQGYELGLKARLFDRSLLANVAFYDYDYDRLQVGANEPAPGGVPRIRTVNSGKARTYGIDVELGYRPRSVEGLSVNASVNWNEAEYEVLTTIPCYFNQTIAMGCTLTPDPTQIDPGTGQPRFITQQLSGTPMIRAPQWVMNFGFDYEFPIGSSMRLRLTNNNQYTDEYVTFPATGRPGNDNTQSDYFTVDAGIALKSADDRWEIAIIGKNLGDELFASNCSASNAAGGIILPFGGDNYGGVAPGTGGTAEKLCFVDGPGRSIWARLTFRPF
jgi:outer membrane receptor protein involved in Fe transport